MQLVDVTVLVTQGVIDVSFSSRRHSPVCTTMGMPESAGIPVPAGMPVSVKLPSVAVCVKATAGTGDAPLH